MMGVACSHPKERWLSMWNSEVNGRSLFLSVDPVGDNINFHGHYMIELKNWNSVLYSVLY